MTATFDVRIFEKIEPNKLAHGKTSYNVRWRVAGKNFKKTYATKTLANSERSKLVSAVRNGEAFDTVTGRPVSEGRNRESVNGYAFARKYAEAKWPRGAANTRRSTADALVTLIPVLFTGKRGKPDDKAIRAALHKWAFNFQKSTEDRPREVSEILEWVEKNTKPVSAFNDPEVVRAALDALATNINGKPAAGTTTARKRAVLSNMLDYAVEARLIDVNHIGTVKWTPPAVAGGTVDPRSVANPTQARALLQGVHQAPGSGPRMVAFFATMYYAALRPGEAVPLRESNLELPKSGWGKIHLSGSNPYAGKEWTNDGGRREQRQLKHRAIGESRTVPCAPELTALLNRHLADFGTDDDGRLFWAERGGDLPTVTYQTMWRQARIRAFGGKVASTSLLAKRPYDLRHAAVSTWLSSGVEPQRVAEWAGHGLAVLLRIYAKFLDGQEEAALQRIQAKLEAG